MYGFSVAVREHAFNWHADITEYDSDTGRTRVLGRFTIPLREGDRHHTALTRALVVLREICASELHE
jgi:hypothetical protein